MAQNIKVGDKVQFGSYGNFGNNPPIYEVAEIKETFGFFGGVIYSLYNNSGGTFDAYKDEVRKI